MSPDFIKNATDMLANNPNISNQFLNMNNNTTNNNNSNSN
jgi:hypothetical protein